MNHPDRITLLDHALGLLDGAARAGVEVHVRACPECAGAAQALAAEQEALRVGLSAPPVDARGVERRVLAAVQGLRVGAGRPPAPPARGPRLLVAALVLIAGGAALLAYRDGLERRRRDVLVRRVVLSERAALAALEAR